MTCRFDAIYNDYCLDCGRPALYDVYSGAGGCSVGYHRAGYCPRGVDIRPQKNYPYAFIQMDALKFLRQLMLGLCPRPSLIHTSPPCQKYSIMTRGRWQDREHPDLIEPTRQLLKVIGLPYVIENVGGAPLENAVMLCGTMFNLRASNGAQLWRHRFFECNPTVWFAPAMCNHESQPAIGAYDGGQHPLRKKRIRKNAVIGVYGSSGGHSIRDNKDGYGIYDRKLAMGINWMTGKELSESIPPAYTEYIGRQMLNQH